MGKKMQIGSLIDIAIYRQAKVVASIQGRRVGDVIDDALKAYLKKYGKVFEQAKNVKRRPL